MELLCAIGIIAILVALCLEVFPKAIGRANRLLATIQPKVRQTS